MKKSMVIVVALVAGIFGGLLSRYVAPPTAFAQNQARITAEVRALSFTLVDLGNRPVGTFTAESDRIVLRDALGRETWSAGRHPKVLPLNK